MKSPVRMRGVSGGSFARISGADTHSMISECSKSGCERVFLLSARGAFFSFFLCACVMILLPLRIGVIAFDFL